MSYATPGRLSRDMTEAVDVNFWLRIKGGVPEEKVAGVLKMHSDLLIGI
jgi:hypothetical protein